MRLAPLLLLLFVPSVAASSVYDSWVLVGEVVTVSDQLVHTAIDDSWNKLLVRTDHGHLERIMGGDVTLEK